MTKTELYAQLARQLDALLGGERNPIANAANMAALIYQTLPDLNWAGLYLLDGEDLVLGPFQGRPACTRIRVGKGVCGTAAERRETLVVENVHEFPGHIACDAASKSEIVVPIITVPIIAAPIITAERLFGVLDLDSPLPGRFDKEDQAGLEQIVRIFVGVTDLDPAGPIGDLPEEV